ncbi:MAG: hypothetical protein GIX03_06400 [Candidatus Eremiobacteraeota bacterium]|nr:hypothetical protein [Candidatus Eremiobacteraeota bacterium]MBC5802627.1 hypothetical protein [Candidatus Eremiobacteraeota bacterium]MBC5822939.1 hypothetical protein [Candidatus Eremiobacteraeota bacterium]
MKCCGSPTTSTAPEPRGDRGRDARQRRDVAAQFAAILTKAAFTPLAGALGFYGDFVVGEVARTLARNEHGGLTDALVRAISANERHDDGASVR